MVRGVKITSFKETSIKETLQKIDRALEEISDINCKLLKNSLSAPDDLLVLQAQELALDALNTLHIMH